MWYDGDMNADDAPLFPVSKRPPRQETVVERQHRFLNAWETIMDEDKTCTEVGISRRTLYRWIAKDQEGFNAKWADLERYRGLRLESKLFEVLDWATAEESRYAKLMQYPTLFLKALQAAMPDKYGDKVSLSQDDAHRIFSELGRLKDDPVRKNDDEARSIDDQVDDILHG